MAVTNNPLRQYFRRPAIYIKLPSGVETYDSTVLDYPETGELPVYPMTAIDEITSRTPDALYSGQAVVDIIKSCVPAVKDPWKLSSMDLDALLIAVKTATEGNDQDFTSECPSCKEQNEYQVNLINALGDISGKPYEETITIGELTIKFKSMSYKELNEINKSQFEIQKSFQTNIDSITDEVEKTKKTAQLIIEITKAAMKALVYSIEYIKTPGGVVDSKEYILDYIQNCDKNTFESLKDKSISIKTATEIKPMKIECPACGHHYEQAYSLNITDFFG